MIINYKVSGSDRKRLVAAIVEHTGEKAKYLGAPGFAYQVGNIHISVDGQVTVKIREAAPLIRFLREKGFQAEDPLTEAMDEETTEESSNVEFFGICISMPRSLFTDSHLENLRNIVESKGNLIRKALGAADIPIEITDEKVSFPWFPENLTSGEMKAYETFICRLCDMARNQKRISAKKKTVDNEKYTFRCFLLRLGFIGDEYKIARKILLRNLSGSTAFKASPRKEAQECE